MSNISVTGNEAQFNEKVTFLKNVDIKGTLFVPQVSGETTFLNRVNFSEDVTFPKIEIFDKLTVGAGGTLFFADTSYDGGKIGIGTTTPEALLDVFGKAKITDLELKNLLVTGISTFVGIATFNNLSFTNQISNIGVVTSNMIHLTGGTYRAGLDARSDSAIIVNEDFAIYSLETDGDYLRTIIEKESNVINIGQLNTSTIQAIDLKPGQSGSVRLHHGTTGTNNVKLQTTGIGVSVLGDLIVKDVGIRTSGVGLGTDVIKPIPFDAEEYSDAQQGSLRLVVDGSVSISKNIYDSSGSPGANGNFLNRDENGIRWVPFEPSFTEGIFIQDEGSFIPTVGAAQSFTILNFVQKNSDGKGTDTLIPTASNPNTQSGLATIFTQDLWGFKTSNAVNSPIYRMSSVGIGTTDPITILQVNSDQNNFFGVTSSGRVGIGSTIPSVKFDLDGSAIINGRLNVSGVTTFKDDVEFHGVGGISSITFDKSDNSLKFADNAKITIGDDGDLQLYHNALNSWIVDQGTGQLVIGSNGEKIRLAKGLGAESLAEFFVDGSVDLYYDDEKRFATSGIGASVFGILDTTHLNVSGVGTFDMIRLLDNKSILLGEDEDLRIRHTGSHSEITDEGAGYLRLGGNRVVIGNADFTETSAVFIQGEGVSLNYAGDKKFETTNEGILVSGGTTTGAFRATGVSTFQDDVIFTGDNYNLSWDTSQDRLEFADLAKLSFGDNTEYQMYHKPDTNDLRVELQGGTNYILLSDVVDIKNASGNADLITAFGDNGTDNYVSLSHNGNRRLRTTGTGVSITDDLNVAGISTFTGSIDANSNLDVTGISTFNDDVKFIGGSYNAVWDKSENALDFSDSAKVIFGTIDGLEIYHLDDSYMKNLVGDLFIQQTDSSKDINIQGSSGVDSIVIDGGGTNNVKLYSSGNQKLETNDGGIDITGHLETDTLRVSGLSTFSGITTVTGETLFSKQFNVSGVSTFGNSVDVNGDLDVDGHTELDDLNVSGVSTFASTVDLDAKVLDQNDDDGTTVSSTLSNTITGASYNAATGVLQITIVGHGFANGDSIQIPDNTITFSCNYGGGGTQTYPRTKDPASGRWLVISNRTNDTFEVNVGDGGLASGNAHVFITASNGVYHSAGQYVKSDYRLASVGAGVSWRPSGVQTKRTIWVSKSGSDTNSGLLEGDAKATIGAAASIAVESDTIKIRPGLYIEDNPIGLRTDVSVTGEDLRLVTVQSKNKNKDVFHVRRGCLIENLNFGGSNVGVSHAGAACVAFPTPSGPDSAITGYTEPGPATEGPSGRWRSPYVRNCTNFMTDSIGLKVDGDNATASSIGADLKSMVVDSYTQYNENGIGVSLTNNGYAQLVSIFTISCDIGIFASSGAQCDLTNSNSSFGNFGLVAVGLGSTQFTGIVSNTNSAGEIIGSTNAEGQDTVVCADVFDLNGISRRPFDGQSLFFRIDLDNYPDVNLNNLNPGTIDGDGRIISPLQQLESVNLIATGEDLSGFSAIDPPSVLIRDADGEVEPKGPQGVIAEATANIDARGILTGVNVIAQGRNYLSGQNIIVDIEGNTGLATAVMSPIFFTVESSTENPVGSIGIATITFNEFIPYELFPDDPFSLQRISRILTSSHSFEYVGAGTDINISTPLQGAIPIKANEIVAKDGAQIPFTSTDQQGNFDIGQGLQINQTTSSISGRDFSRSIQAQVTPLILALR